MAVVRSIGLAIVPRQHGALIAQLKTGRSLRGMIVPAVAILGGAKNPNWSSYDFFLNYALLFEICNL